MKRGRKRITSTLGERRRYTFYLYPIEFQLLNIEFQNLKKQRKQFETKEENNV